MEFEDLKRVHEEKYERADELYKKRSNEAILRDFENWKQSNLNENVLENRTGEVNRYIYKEQFDIAIRDGNFEVDDHRGTTFLWVFSLESSEITYSSLFYFEGEPHTIEFADNPAMQSGIEEAISNLDKVIEFLENNPLDDYTYYDAHKDVSKNTLNEVIKYIEEEDPVNF